MLHKLKTAGNLLKRELAVYRLLVRDGRTPGISKILLGLAIGYAILPFDLIPGWIPVIGHLDDFIVVPALVFVSLKFMPDELREECRHKIYRGPLAI